MPQLFPLVPPVEYLALPNTPELDQAEEPDNTERDLQLTSRTLSQPSPPAPPPGYSALPNFSEARPSVGQPRQCDTEGVADQSTSEPASFQLRLEPRSKKRPRVARRRTSFIW
jgi:hypothetical protein